MIYLDNSATTKPLPRVTAAVAAAMEEDFGNPSSLHRLGLTAEKTLKGARKAVAASLRVKDTEITFTGSGTEADNTALFSMARAGRRRGKKIITSDGEHPAVLEACRALSENGFSIAYIRTDHRGFPDLAQLEEELTEDTILVSMMAVNNELGTIFPIKEISQMVRSKTKALLHTDGVQAYGKVNMALGTGLVDAASISAHKVHGPKGVGALWVRENLHLQPFVYGGGQERGFRSGTENMPGIAGFGEAARILQEEGADRQLAMAAARQRLMEGLLAQIPDITINSPVKAYTGNGIPYAEGARGLAEEDILCCPAILNVSFLGCRGEVLLHSLEQKDIYVSTGSACSSNSKKKGSHVLQAAGLSFDQVEGAIRFSLSGDNTPEQMDQVVEELSKIVASMRRLMRRR